nr:MAG TPA: hypothetical protein [Bacteriophage sp.]
MNLKLFQHIEKSMVLLKDVIPIFQLIRTEVL